MKKHLVLLLLLVIFMAAAGGRKAYAFTSEPRVTWSPQSRCFADGSEAVYTATVSGTDLTFAWKMEFGGKTYDISTEKDKLMKAGLSSYCSEVWTENYKNRTLLFITGVKKGLDSVGGNFTKVWCEASNSRGGEETSKAYVIVGAKNAPDPPNIYVMPVAAFLKESSAVPKVACEVVSEKNGAEYAFQWYEITGGKLETIKLVVGAEDSVLVPEFEKPYTDYVCKVTVTRDGVSADSYSPPVNVYQYSGEIDPSYEQLVITKKPTKERYDLGEKLDLSGLTVDYYKDGVRWENIAVSDILTDITRLDYAGPVYVTLRYKNAETGFRAWVYPSDSGYWCLEEDLEYPLSLEPLTEGVKTSYKTGEKLDTKGLKIRVLTASGFYDETDLSQFEITCGSFKKAGSYTVKVVMKDSGAEGAYTVTVKEAETQPPTTEAPTTETPTTEAPATEAPTTAEAETETSAEGSTEESTQPETETAAPETPEAETTPEETKAPETTEKAAESSKAESTAAPSSPQPSTENGPSGGEGGGSNAVLYIVIGVLAVACGLMGGILIGRKKAK